MALQALPLVMLDIVGRVWSWDPGEGKGKGKGREQLGTAPREGKTWICLSICS